MHALSLILTFLGVIQGLFLAGFFFVRKKNIPANRMLGWFILLFSLGLFEPVLETLLPQFEIVVLLSFLGNSSLLYGPLIYGYTSWLTRPKSSYFRFSKWHFLPSLLFLGIDLVTFSISGKKELDAVTLIDILAYELFVVQILTYTILAVKKLANYVSELKQENRIQGIQHYIWLRNLFLLLTMIYLFSFITMHLNLFLQLNLDSLFTGIKVAIVLLIYLISYKVMLQPETFQFNGDTTLNKKEVHLKYERSGLNKEKSQAYLANLLEYLQREKPFLNSNLNLQDLSDCLDINKNQLSQIMNEQLGKNFYQLINAYRVKEAQRLMHDPQCQHFTLLAIGLESGFSSKTTFNNNFKKITGLTPSEWKEKGFQSDGWNAMKS